MAGFALSFTKRFQVMRYATKNKMLRQENRSWRLKHDLHQHFILFVASHHLKPFCKTQYKNCHIMVRNCIFQTNPNQLEDQNSGKLPCCEAKCDISEIEDEPLCRTSRSIGHGGFRLCKRIIALQIHDNFFRPKIAIREPCSMDEKSTLKVPQYSNSNN